MPGVELRNTAMAFDHRSRPAASVDSAAAPARGRTLYHDVPTVSSGEHAAVTWARLRRSFSGKSRCDARDQTFSARSPIPRFGTR